MSDLETSGPRHARRLQLLGLLLVLVAGFLPSFAVRPEGPADYFLRGIEDPGPYKARLRIGGSGERPAPLCAWAAALGAFVTGSGTGAALWQLRASYPFVLALGWLLAWLLTMRSKRAAWVCLAWLTGLLIAVEAAYLSIDYEGLFPALLGPWEAWLIFLFVVAVLLWHPRRSQPVPWRRLLAAQALLSILHLITLPCTHVRPRIETRSLFETLGAIPASFGPAFWLALVGCGLIAWPVYLPKRRVEDVAAAPADQGL